MKKQVVIIHGGDTFETREQYLDFLRDYEINIERYKKDRDDWKKPLRNKLGPMYEVIIPIMPNKTDARYEEWEIWMDKLISFLEDEIILIGHSMGGAFLAKYLSEKSFPKKIKGVFLVSAVYEKDSQGYSLATFALPEKLNLQSENIYLYHSKDDPVVPFSELNKFERALPQAKSRILEDRQHINHEEFPELVEDIIRLN